MIATKVVAKGRYKLKFLKKNSKSLLNQETVSPTLLFKLWKHLKTHLCMLTLSESLFTNFLL